MAQAHAMPMPSDYTPAAVAAKRDSLIPLTPDGVVQDRRAIRVGEKERELVLQENAERWVLMPIEFPSLWDLYKKIETSIWTPGDFNLTKQLATLPPCVQGALLELSCAWLVMMGKPARGEHLIQSSESKENQENLPPVFSREEPVPGTATLTVVNKVVGAVTPADPNPLIGDQWDDIIDVSCEFMGYVQSPEARAYLGFQSMFENFHREVITQYVQVLSGVGSIPPGILLSSGQESRLAQVFSNWENSATLTEKKIWFEAHTRGFCEEDAVKILEGDKGPEGEAPIHKDESDFSPFAEVLVALAVFKCIFLAGVALIPALPGTEGQSVIDSATKMWQDMLLHADFAAHIYASFERKLPKEVVQTMVTRAAEIEYNFLMDVFSRHFEMIPLNSNEVAGFLNAVCHRLFNSMGYENMQVLASSSLPHQGLVNKVGTHSIYLEPIKLEHPHLTRIVPIEKTAVAESESRQQRARLMTTTAADEEDLDLMGSAKKKRKSSLEFTEDF